MTVIFSYFWRLLPANPILLRVVDSGGKRRRDLFIRCIYLGLLVGFVLFAILFSNDSNAASSTDLSTLAKTSSNLFQHMSYLQLGLVALLAPIFTAGAITQEKDSQTYDILLATPLSNGQIVLGSLMSRLFFVVALLVSGIPIFSITQIFGGVAIRSILLSFGIATATAFVTGALAMAIATFKVGTRRTIFSFYLFIVIYLAGLIVLDQNILESHPFVGVDAQGKTVTGTSWFTCFSPFLALRTLFNDPAYLPPKFESLPDDYRRWPFGWMLSNPASFYVSFMFLLSFLLVTPSIILLRRMAQATVTEKPAYRLVLGAASGLAMFIALLAGGSSGIYVAGVLAVVAFGFLLPWVRDPSWVPFLNRGETAETVAGGGEAGARVVGRAPQSRKPRTVWTNPIAWREAKTKASAARATLLRYGFIFAGLVGAIVLVYRFSRFNVPAQSVGPSDYNSALKQITIGSDTCRVPDIDDPKFGDPSADPSAVPTKVAYPIEVEVDDPSGPGRKKFQPFDLRNLKVPMEVVQPAPGDSLYDPKTRAIAHLQLRPIARLLDAEDVRKYLFGLAVVEFAIILLIVTNAAASTVTREKEDGTLDLLLSSPITSRYYIWGKLRGLVSFVLPLVAVPVASALIFILYDLARIGSDPDFKWIVFPEAVVLLPGMLVIVSAFAAILGMQMSLRCRTTVMAVMSSVGIVVGVCAAMGFCGYNMLSPGPGSNYNNSGFTVGIGAFSPFTLLQMFINPYAPGGGFPSSGGPADDDQITTNRIIIVVCSLIAIAGYTAIVWSMYQSMVKNFDMTIRKQSR